MFLLAWELRNNAESKASPIALFMVVNPPDDANMETDECYFGYYFHQQERFWSSGSKQKHINLASPFFHVPVGKECRTFLEIANTDSLQVLYPQDYETYGLIVTPFHPIIINKKICKDMIPKFLISLPSIKSHLIEIKEDKEEQKEAEAMEIGNCEVADDRGDLDNSVSSEVLYQYRTFDHDHFEDYFHDVPPLSMFNFTFFFLDSVCF